MLLFLVMLTECDQKGLGVGATNTMMHCLCNVLGFKSIVFRAAMAAKLYNLVEFVKCGQHFVWEKK